MAFLLFLLIATPFIPASRCGSSLRTHSSDTLKLKCDALPFRTHYAESRCHFVLMTEQSLAESNSMCATNLPGAKVSSAPSSVYNKLFVEKSEFHTPSYSKGEKKALCSYEIRHVCGDEEPLLPGGKCAFRGGKKMNYANAASFCASKSASLPFLQNDEDNAAILEFLENDSTWTALKFTKKWSEPNRFTRYAMCPKTGYSIPSSDKQPYCKTNFALVANGGEDSRGYWSGSEQKELQGVICLRDASSDFWTVKVIAAKPTAAPKPKWCVEDHVFDPDTGDCKWTGPANACIKLIHHNGNAMYVNMGNDLKGWGEMTNEKFPGFNDMVTKTVVRKGCRDSYWGDGVNGWMLMWRDVPYGKWEVPSAATGTMHHSGFGLSNLICECDPPTKAEDEEEKKKECVEDHEYDPETGECEWTGPDNSCMKIIDYQDAKKAYINITDYPNNRKLALNAGAGWSQLPAGFEDVTSTAVIRRGCRASFWGGQIDGNLMMWKNVSYGKWEVPCYRRKSAYEYGRGLSSLTCECDADLKSMKATFKPTICVEDHKLDKATGECKWTGPANACAKLISPMGIMAYVTIPNYPNNLQRWGEMNPNDFPGYNDYVATTVIRNGCRASYWGDGVNGRMLMWKNVPYGKYEVPCYEIGTIYPSGFGMSNMLCECDHPSKAVDESKKKICVEDHEYDPETGECEWTGPENACLKLTQNQGAQYVYVTITDYPNNLIERLDAGNGWSKIPVGFEDRASGTVIRRGCRASFWGGQIDGNLLMWKRVPYGKYDVPCAYTNTAYEIGRGLSSLICECEPNLKTKGKSG